MTNGLFDAPAPVGPLGVTLRPYQQEAVDGLYTWFGARDGNPLIVVPTGGGKSLIIAAFAHSVLSQWPGERILVMTHVRELIDQNYKAMLRAWPTAPAGIYSAGLNRREHDARILFAGIQSVYEKAAKIGWADLVVIDEAHLIPKSGMGMYRQLLNDLQSMNSKLKVIGLTATPFRTGEGSLDKGDDRLFHGVAYDCELTKLILAGYLSRVVAKSTVAPINTAGLHVRMGEYVEGELEQAALVDGLVHRQVNEVMARGQDRKAWLVFCCSIKHAETVAAEITSRGITTATVFGETPKAERDATVSAFKAGTVRCVVNVNVLCLDEHTEILTSAGWVGIDDMTPEHLAAAWDFDGSIRFATPKNIVRRQRREDERMVVLEGRNHSIRVTANHRMVQRPRGGKWSIASADSLVGEKVMIPVSGNAAPLILEPPTPSRAALTVEARIRALSYVRRRSGSSPEDARNSAAEHVLRSERRRFKVPSELTLDECSFIGFWLGDGSLSGGRCVLSQSNAYPRIIKWFDGVLARLAIGHSRHGRPPNKSLPHGYVVWSINRGTGGGSQRRETGYFPLTPYLAKDGTPLFWGLSEKQLAALLHGFWMADGNHGDGSGNSARGRFIAGTQRSLYEMLQAVMACRGWRGTVTRLAPPQMPAHKQQWRFSWRRAADSLLMRERLSAEDGWRRERVWCVTSATGNIVTRRNGKVAVVGNTTGFDAPPTDLVVLLRPTFSPVLYVQMIGRGLRTAPDKKDALVLDFGGNVMRHGPIDAVKIREPKKGEGGGMLARECPNCQTLVSIAVTVCPECGFEWAVLEDAQGSKLDEKPADLDIVAGLSTRNPIERWDVYSSRFTPHNGKSGGPITLCAEYSGGFQQRAREWICFEHPAGSFPRRKAETWWRERGGKMPAPETVDMALVRIELGELRKVTGVTVDTRGEWPEIRGVRLEEAEAGANDFADAPAKPSQVDYGDIPF